MGAVYAGAASAATLVVERPGCRLHGGRCAAAPRRRRGFCRRNSGGCEVGHAAQYAGRRAARCGAVSRDHGTQRRSVTTTAARSRPPWRSTWRDTSRRSSCRSALEISPGRLTAGGALTLRQSALGLTPFSVFLGALAGAGRNAREIQARRRGELSAARRGKRLGHASNSASSRIGVPSGAVSTVAGKLPQRQRHLTRRRYPDFGQSGQRPADVTGIEEQRGPRRCAGS